MSSDNIIAKDARPEVLADGFKFTEGPAADSEGNIYFTDQPNNKIWKWSVENELSLFHENPGRSNGLYFNQKGNLIACADLENELWSIDSTGNHTVLISHYDGKKLNGPNDLWIHPNGTIYFTDPLYPREYWERGPDKQQEGEFVFMFNPETGLIKIVEAELTKPNGIIGSPDGKFIYVADIGAGKTFSYHILPDGSLNGKKLVAPMGSDGMTLDAKGNLYLTGKGVTVFNPCGEQIAHIHIDEPWTSNVTFGGKKHNTLFITASDKLYGISMNVKGAK